MNDLNQKLKCFALSSILISTGFFVMASTTHAEKTGNGGDMCEDRIKTIRDDIASWIQQGGSAGLKLPQGITLTQYNSTMLSKFKQAQVSCTDKPITIEGVEKTCENFVDSKNIPQVLCNRTSFNETSQSDQYVLIHHEFAGISGFEVSSGADSHYDISDQITGYLVDQVTKKLAVKPASTNVTSTVFLQLRDIFDHAQKIDVNQFKDITAITCMWANATFENPNTIDFRVFGRNIYVNMHLKQYSDKLLAIEDTTEHVASELDPPNPPVFPNSEENMYKFRQSNGNIVIEWDILEQGGNTIFDFATCIAGDYSR